MLGASGKNIVYVNFDILAFRTSIGRSKVHMFVLRVDSSPLFEGFFILGGPRGTQQKKLKFKT
jgi:hypothetical protein